MIALRDSFVKADDDQVARSLTTAGIAFSG